MYVLEGITPCIQSMQLQAGDTVTFSRIDPEGKLVMGFRKASSATAEQDTQTGKAGNGFSTSTEMIQSGVYRCSAMPHPPGTVNFFMTLDGYMPISQVLSFDYRSAPSVRLNGGVTSSEDDDKLKWKEFQVQTRLAHLLFSTTNNISIRSNRTQTKSLKEAKTFALDTSSLIEKDWMNLLTLSGSIEASHVPATRDLFELVLKNKLQEWLLEEVAEGCKTTEHDSQGQGAIHLCAILDYAWAVPLFFSSGMSLDFRDAFGWTALHWAAYFKRKKMVAALLSAGANPSLVTDPNPEFPGGCTAADLASKQGHEGLAAYLAEKGLTAHFQAISLSGNITAPMPPGLTNQVSSEHICTENLSEQEFCLKESLAAYRNAADAANRIQAALRERVLKQQTKAALLAKPEMEAAQIVAALKIQHAFRNYSRRRTMRAAARIQSRFRSWKFRRHFLNLRKQTIKIQAAFRGHRVRRQYNNILWSVGVLEKAILRWRLKRKGLRGIQVGSKGASKHIKPPWLILAEYPHTIVPLVACIADGTPLLQDNSTWVCALLLAVLFQNRDIIRSNATMHSIPVLANLLRSEESANRYFAAQALASLVCNGSRGTLLAVANSRAANGLIPLLGCADTDIADLVELSEEFSLVHNPKQIILEKFGYNAYRVELPEDVFISDVFNIRHLTPYAGENSSLRSSFSEEGESDEDIKSDQALKVPVPPAIQSQQATPGKSKPGNPRRSKRLQNKPAWVN